MRWFRTQIVFFILYLLDQLLCEQLPPLYWNSSNSLLNNDLTLSARIRDTLDIHCPFYNLKTNKTSDEYSIIYMVSRFGFENCLLDDEKPVGQCLTPLKETVIKMTFRVFTPMPNGLEFQPGETYYFISTSGGTEDTVHNRVGGLCLEKNLRIKYHVNEKLEKSVESSTTTTLSTKFQRATEKETFSLSQNKLRHIGSSKRDEIWTDNSIQEIIDINADPSVDNLKSSLIIPDNKVDIGQRSDYSVQHLTLYEIHESSGFDDTRSIQYYMNNRSRNNYCLNSYLILLSTYWIVYGLFSIH